MFKVLTLNTWNTRGPWEKRWGIIMEGVKRYAPDVIGFQELFSADWAEVVSKKMKYADYYFVCEGAGNVIYSRNPILRRNFKKLDTRSPTESYDRYICGAVMRVRSDEVAFLNTHLSWKPDEADVRKNQADEILDFADSFCGTRPSLLVGDFNAVSESDEVKKIIQRGFTDTYLEVGIDPSAVTWDNQNKYAAGSSHRLPDRRIDFIFARNLGGALQRLVSSSIIFNETTEEGIFASDHYGVFTVFER